MRISTSGLRHLLSAALLAAAAALSGSAIGDPAIACAAPNQEWDVNAYDDCMRKLILSPGFGEGSSRAARQKCCTDSGGVWNEAQGSCQSPPAEPADAPQQPTLPGVAPRPGEATQPPPPPPPPVQNPGVAPRPGVIETFTPAPIG